LGHSNHGHFLGLETNALAGSGEQGEGRPNPRSEEADDYPAVARLNDRWRVIVCAAGIQWILQRRAGKRYGRARWEGRSYCRTSDALNRLCRRHADPIDAFAAAILASLPERIVEHQRSRAALAHPEPQAHGFRGGLNDMIHVTMTEGADDARSR
jgi:hypothetical protein